ncbi:MAG: enoyl-CoA hydratase-related protein [Acidimicrobiia bacterium]
MATQYETILVEDDRGVTTITLNRPEQRNAINLTMEQELYAAMQSAEADDAVRAVVVTGAGSAFCSGVDLAGGSAFGADAHAEHDAALGVTSDTIWERVAYWRMKTPVIGAINGHAIGVGMTLPMLFDIRYVAEDAKLSFVFTRRGIIPEANSTWLVPRLIGLSRGLDLLLSGRQFSGREAAEWGLCSRALPADQVLPAALDLAHDIADNTAPLSVAITKQLVYDFMDAADRPAAITRETKLTWWVGEQADAMEGVMAWFEKRPPNWTVSKHLDLPPDLA